MAHGPRVSERSLLGEFDPGADAVVEDAAVIDLLRIEEAYLPIVSHLTTYAVPITERSGAAQDPAGLHVRQLACLPMFGKLPRLFQALRAVALGHQAAAAAARVRGAIGHVATGRGRVLGAGQKQRAPGPSLVTSATRSASFGVRLERLFTHSTLPVASSTRTPQMGMASPGENE